ncbi:8-amino-7-oxononanoate synthase [Corynebacterium uropygiale]|uniref:8-amino-7-oxononanoate synthase n=1 Tax=Corynebacterium uropygiale TaxID=1775911 RepID=A0A9X1QPI1_9CORY|nr:8-amino-7-oxononanoate synthase [Corynebacterium uropygiale]MCF4007197.1 8-amino-7-oxononanoate synthase [Corynebacterium uropygiale]
MSSTESLAQHAAALNEAWRAQGLERHEREFGSGQEPEALVDGRRVLLFSSSNYLGLAQHPRLLAAATEATRRFGAGSGGSRLTTGTTALHRELERSIAEWLGTEDAIFFATGYQANLSTLAAIGGPDVLILSDELNHASIIDGARLARARVAVFPHGDLDAAERILASRPEPHALVVSDGLFSMHAAVADLPGLSTIARQHGAWTMIDDAHAIGTLGEEGRGSVEVHGQHPDLLIGTASKALGVEGGFVAARSDIIRFLRHRARSYMFSTAPTPATVAAVHAAITLLREDPSPVRALQRNARLLSTLLADAHLIPHALSTPIIPVPVGDSRRAMRIAARLEDAGVLIPAIRYPTVKEGEAILRATVMATHTEEHIRRCAEAVVEAMAEDA